MSLLRHVAAPIRRRDRSTPAPKPGTSRRKMFAAPARRAVPLIPALLLAVLFLGIPSHAAAAEPQGPAPVAVTFENPFGTVHFNHETHAGKACSTCHPPFDFQFAPGSGYSQRAHTLCVDCHRKADVPAECANCHTIHKRTTKPLDPAMLKAATPAAQPVLDFFTKRRSIRKFQDKPVPEELVRDLLKAAMAAPTAGNWQPWEFVVVTDPETRKALAATSPFAKFVKDAPVIIAVAGRKDNHWAPFDCALAAGNILLAAANVGLGGTYCGYDTEREAGARAVLGIPDDYVLFSLLPVGYPAETKPVHTKYNEDRVHMNRFTPGRPETVVGD